MNKLTPCNADVTLVYDCPKCDLSHSVRREETLFPGGVLCYCGAKLKFKTIHKIKMSFVYGKGKTSKPIATPVLDAIIDAEVVDDAVSCLVHLGHRKSDASKLVKTVAEKCPSMSAEEIVLTVVKQDS